MVIPNIIGHISMKFSEKKNIVIVRAGKQSLHHKWLESSYIDRNFDVIVSYFDEEAYSRHIDQTGVTAYYFKGGKWDGLYNTISNFADIFEQYEYFWLPDDDIDCTAEDINHLFNAMHEHQLKVAQPSLTHNSYFTYFLLLHCPGFKIRYSNFIEVMVPCLRNDLLKLILPQFEYTMSGFGLDYLWCRLPGVGEYGAAIIDDVQVRHTRPVGKVLISNMKEAGRNPKDEEHRLCQQFGIAMSPTPLTYAGKKVNGEFISGKKKIGLAMFRSYWSALLKSSHKTREFNLSHLFQLIRRQLMRRMDISEARRHATQQQKA